MHLISNNFEVLRKSFEFGTDLVIYCTDFSDTGDYNEYDLRVLYYPSRIKENTNLKILFLFYIGLCLKSPFEIQFYEKNYSISWTPSNLIDYSKYNLRNLDFDEWLDFFKEAPPNLNPYHDHFCFDDFVNCNGMNEIAQSIYNYGNTE